MVINNEDYQAVDFIQGVFEANPILIPDGYAELLENVIIRDGVAEGRGSFTAIAPDPVTFGVTNGWMTQNEPENPPIVANLPISGGNTLLGVFASTYAGGPFPQKALVGITTFGGIVVKQTPPTVTLNGPLVVYNQTLYGGATTGIIKLGVTNYPTSITETLIVGSPTQNSGGLLAHKNRLFTWATDTNRIYFTDAPAVGALPEVWNVGVNFIDVNGVGGKTNIQSVISLGNYLYIFTNTGLLSLYTQGAPSNWILKMINSSIAVRNRLSVVSKNSLIYYVTAEGVFVTDGFEFKLLSQALSDAFNGQYEATNTYLMLFDGGINLGVTNVTNGNIKVFHTKLNKIAWTTLSIPNPDRNLTTIYADVLTNNQSVAYSSNPGYILGAEIPKDAGSSFYDSWLIVRGISKHCLYRYKSGDIALDTSPQYTGNAVSSTITAVAPNIIIPKTIMETNFMRVKKWQTGQFLIGGQRTFNMQVQKYKNLDTTQIPTTPPFGPTLVPVTPAPNSTADTFLYDGYLAKFGIFLHSFSLKLRFVFTGINDATNSPSRVPISFGPLGVTSILEATNPRKGVRDQ